MPDLPEQLNRLRERLERETVECPAHKDPQIWKDGVCLLCSDNDVENPGRIPNPAYDALREVVRQDCSCIACKSIGEELHGKDCICKGTGYYTRSWEGLPKGALAGSLLHEMGNHPRLIEVACRASGEGYAHVRQVSDRWFVERVGEILLDSPDPDLAAVAAVFEALEG